MKKLVLATVLFATTTFAMAQKVGHVFADELIEKHPSKATADKQLKTIQDNFATALKAKEDAYQAKVKEYQEKAQTTKPTEEQMKEWDDNLNKIAEEAKQLQKEASENFEKKREELYDPILTGVQKAIDKVSAVQGLNYVVDASRSGVIVYLNGGNDITPAVKKELGIQN